MKTAKVVELLRQQGHKVSTYKRPDGGIRITKIDGIKFSLSDGNAFGRELVNAPQSVQEYTQRRKASQYALEGKKRQKAKMPSLTIRKSDSAKRKKEKRAVKRALQKARKVMRESAPTTEQISKKIKREGYTRTATKLLNTARHTAGLSYPEQVDSLRDYLMMVFEQAGMDYSNEVALLNANREHFADKFIKLAYEDLYELQKAVRDGRPQLLEGLRAQVSQALAQGALQGYEIYKSF